MSDDVYPNLNPKDVALLGEASWCVLPEGHDEQIDGLPTILDAEGTALICVSGTRNGPSNMELAEALCRILNACEGLVLGYKQYPPVKLNEEPRGGVK